LSQCGHFANKEVRGQFFAIFADVLYVNKKPHGKTCDSLNLYTKPTNMSSEHILMCMHLLLLKIIN